MARPVRGMAGGLAVGAACAALLSGCAGREPEPAAAAGGRALVERTLPAVPDRAGWADDVYAGFKFLGISPTRENVCAVVAVIEQESGFVTDPEIPGLPAIAWREIDERAARAGVPQVVVHGVLKLESPGGRSYAERIDHARTERDLSDVYEDFIGAVPMGRSLFADRNPIRTRGPMQVHVNFAEQFSARRPYPYSVQRSIADEVFTRRGGVYFGIAHLLAYTAPYDRFLYRFADFNAGQYASRNAAFQRAVSVAAGVDLIADGALLPHDGTGQTEVAVLTLAPRLDLDEAAAHDALERGKTAEFEKSPLYERVFALAERSVKHSLPRAQVPTIQLRGPKLTRRLTTAWYANRVNQRFERCLNR